MSKKIIEITYEDLDKFNSSDVEIDAVYHIKRDNSWYPDIKTGKDLKRIIEKTNELIRKNSHMDEHDNSFTIDANE